MKINRYIGTMLGLLLILPSSVSAATLLADGQITLSDNDAQGDVYLAGAVVNVVVPVRGDLLTAGANVNVTGDVDEDLWIAGSNINVSGNIGDDLRAVGSSVIVNGNVEGDLFVGGGTFQLSSGTVKGDAYIGAGTIIIDGNIDGELVIGGGDVTINGKVGSIRGEIERLKISSTAVVEGNVDYSSNTVADIAQGASVVGELLRSDSKVMKDKTVLDKQGMDEFFGGLVGMFVLIKIVAAALVALYLVIAMPKSTKIMALNINKKPWMALLKGILLHAIAPIAIILLFGVGVGFPIAIGLIAFWAIIWVIAYGFVGVVVGSWIFQIFKRSKVPVLTWMSALVGVLVTVLVAFIPIIGWLFVFIVYMMAVGVVLDFVYSKLQQIEK